MKKRISLIGMVLIIGLNSCGIFKKGCNCPKVYYKSYPQSRK